MISSTCHTNISVDTANQVSATKAAPKLNPFLTFCGAESPKGQDVRVVQRFFWRVSSQEFKTESAVDSLSTWINGSAGSLSLSLSGEDFLSTELLHDQDLRLFKKTDYTSPDFQSDLLNPLTMRGCCTFRSCYTLRTP